uniref:Uncharacterized protein n=1 Tax=Arundo donax TaxID=35708 RepID=A0A0A9CAU0_ARUDO
MPTSSAPSWWLKLMLIRSYF